MNHHIASRPFPFARIVAIAAGVAGLAVLAGAAGFHFRTIGPEIAAGNGTGLSGVSVQLSRPGEYLLREGQGSVVRLGAMEVRWTNVQQSASKVFVFTQTPAGTVELKPVPTRPPRSWISWFGQGKPKAAFTVERPGKYFVMLNAGESLTREVSSRTVLGLFAALCGAGVLFAAATLLEMTHRKKTRRTGP